MRIAITGATGYVGRNLLPVLQAAVQEADILVVSRDLDAAKQLFPKVKHCSVDALEMVTDFNPEIVLHMATLSTSADKTDIIEPMIEANILFGVKMLDAVKQCDALKLFVNIGSFAEYRLGIEQQKAAYLYTATKSAFRHFVDYYAESYHFRYLTLVLYTVYGGVDLRKKIIDYVFDALDAAEPVKMTAGEQCLDFVHVSDVVSALVTTVTDCDNLCNNLPQGAELHIGTGKGTTIRAMAEMVAQTTGKQLNVAWGALPYRPLDVMKAIAPVSKQPKAWTWKAKTTLSDGIKEKASAIMK